MKSKYAIASFVVGIVSGLFILMAAGSDMFLANPLIFSLSALIGSFIGLILSVISFYDMRKKNLEGKIWAVMGGIISIFVVLLYFYLC